MIRTLILIVAFFITIPIFSAVATGTGSHALVKSKDLGRSWVRSDAGIPEETRINTFGSLGATLFDSNPLDTASNWASSGNEVDS